MNPILQKEQDTFGNKFSPDWWMGFGTSNEINKQGTDAIKSFLAESNQRMYEAGVREAVERVIPQHNARILNEFQAQGKPDMPMIAYDVNVCLVPAIIKATKDTVESELLSLIKEK